LHLLASIPHGLCVEIFHDPLRDPMWWELPLNRPMMKDGFMHVPDAPGLGIDLSPEVIAKFRAAPTVA
jgi:L-alanine-DL-glutamate epimerase-like enolase superfamily enzyme